MHSFPQRQTVPPGRRQTRLVERRAARSDPPPRTSLPREPGGDGRPGMRSLLPAVFVTGLALGALLWSPPSADGDTVPMTAAEAAAHN